MTRSNDIKQTEYTSLDMCFSIYQFGERHFQFCCFLIVEWPQSEHWDSWVCSFHLGVCWLYTIFSEPWNISFPLKLNVDKDQKPYSNYFMNSKCEHNDKGSRGRKQTGMSSDTLSQIFFRHPRKLKPMTSKTQLCLTLKNLVKYVTQTRRLPDEGIFLRLIMFSTYMKHQREHCHEL